MSQRLLASNETVQVFSPTLVEDALICTIVSSPSGSILLRTISTADFARRQGEALLDSLSNAVESILGEGIAVGAVGTQLVDPASGLLYDAVVFTVAYPQGSGSQAAITAPCEVPLSVLVADTQFGSFIQGGTAPERILAVYNQLASLAGA